MPNPPAFQYYPADMATDTIVRFWSMEELGCYHQIIDYLWLNGGLMSEDLTVISKLFRVKRRDKAEKMWSKIKVKFKINDGTITHKRVTAEMQRQAETRLARQESGKKGADARWGKDGNATNLPMAKNASSTPITTPTPSSLIGIEENNLSGGVGLELEKQIKVTSMRFRESLEKTFPRMSKHEATTFSRVTLHLSDMVRRGIAELEIFDKALGWADEAMSAGARNPKGLFVAKAKLMTGFTGQGLMLEKNK